MSPNSAPHARYRQDAARRDRGRHRHASRRRAARRPRCRAGTCRRRAARPPFRRRDGLGKPRGHDCRPGGQGDCRCRRLGLLTSSADACRKAGLPVDIVSCGGTGTFPYCAQQPGVTEIEAGGAIFSDMHYRTHYHLDFPTALTLLATVISRPTGTRIIIDAGKKAMSSDAAAPMPIGVEAEPVRLSAEHGTIDLTAPNDRRASAINWNLSSATPIPPCICTRRLSRCATAGSKRYGASPDVAGSSSGNAGGAARARRRIARHLGAQPGIGGRVEQRRDRAASRCAVTRRSAASRSANDLFSTNGRLRRVVDDIVRVLAADRLAEVEHHRLGHDEPAAEIEIGAHPRRDRAAARATPRRAAPACRRSRSRRAPRPNRTSGWWCGRPHARSTSPPAPAARCRGPRRRRR